MKRDDFLTMTDERLLQYCEISACRGSGNGGQKRNKTSNSVRLRLTVLGVEIAAEDCSERSMFRNRANALAKLRNELAWKVRETPSPQTLPDVTPVSPNNPRYFLWCAHLVDVFAEAGWQVAEAAARLNTTTSRLTKCAAASPEFFRRFNEARVRAGMTVIHP